MPRKPTSDETIDPTITDPTPPGGSGPDPAMSGTPDAPVERHGWWGFGGARDAAGGPLEYFTGIPARDLAPDDVALLTDEQYGVVVASRLYREAEAPPPREGQDGDNPPSPNP